MHLAVRHASASLREPPGTGTRTGGAVPHPLALADPPGTPCQASVMREASTTRVTGATEQTVLSKGKTTIYAFRHTNLVIHVLRNYY